MICDNYLEAATADWVREHDRYAHQPGHFAVHQAGACLRQRIYDATGAAESNPADDQTQLVFELGRQWHAVVQSVLSDRYGAKLEAPVTFEGVNLAGTADAVNDVQVWEIKTTHPFAFDRRLRDGPAPEHWLQASCYAYGLGLPGVEVVYVDRSAGRVSSFTATMDEPDLVRHRSLRAAVAAEIQILRGIQHHLHSLLADPAGLRVTSLGEDLDHPDHWQCRFCRFRDLCWS